MLLDQKRTRKSFELVDFKYSLVSSFHRFFYFYLIADWNLFLVFLKKYAGLQGKCFQFVVQWIKSSYLLSTAQNMLTFLSIFYIYWTQKLFFFLKCDSMFPLNLNYHSIFKYFMKLFWSILLCLNQIVSISFSGSLIQAVYYPKGH